MGSAVCSKGPACVDVAIIGCGPVGAFAANLLGRTGLTVLIVDREADVAPHPRACHVDHEMIRLFQSLGLRDSVISQMRAAEGHVHIGADRGVIRFMGTAGRPRPFGWSNDYFFDQPELERALRSGFIRLPNVEFRPGCELIDFTQQDCGVTLRLSHDSDETTIAARWVIACDGASSIVRRQLNIPLEDMQFEEPWLVVDAEVHGAVRFPTLTGIPAGADLQKLSVMMCDPSRPTTIVPGRGNHRRWEFMLLPGEDDEAMMQPGRVAELMAPWLGDTTFSLTRAATYRFHGLIARQWRRSRVFLAGDAAHQTPPFFGQGLCHGLRDVANLAWKFALVIRGKASEALLDSYYVERAPHVRSVIEAAISAGRYICLLNADEAAKRDAQVRAHAQGSGQSTASDLIPALGGGVLLPSRGAGERFIQPRLNGTPDGPLLDDVTGTGWRLFVADSHLEEALHGRDACALPLDVTVLAAGGFDDGGAIQAWLTARGAIAVLVRPDFYVFGTADRNPARLLEALASHMGTAPAEVTEESP